MFFDVIYKNTEDEKIKKEIKRIEDDTLKLINNLINIIKSDRFLKNYVVAIALTGSMACCEGTIHKINNKLIMSDVDLFIITEYYNPIFNRKINKLCKEIFTNSPIKIDAGPMPVRSLSSSKSIMLYELKEKVNVFYGDKNVLDKIPIYSVKDISKGEGIRLLLNRIIELLKTVTWRNNKLVFNDDFYKWYTKLILGCGESILLLEDLYVPTFIGRLKIIEDSELITQFDGLKEEFITVTKNKFNPEFKPTENYKDNLILFNKAREYLLKVLEYYLKIYFKNDKELLLNLPNLLEIKNRSMISNIYSKIYYFKNYFQRNKSFPPISFIKISANLYAKVSGIYLIAAYSDNGMDSKLLTESINRSNRIVKCEIDKKQDVYYLWEKTRKNICRVWDNSTDFML